MHRPNMNRLWFGAILLGPASLTAAVPGCHNGEQCRSCNDITPGAIPQPNGTYDCQWIHAEMARADQDKFVIYQYEWSADGTKLTPSGQEHVAQIAQGLCSSALSSRDRALALTTAAGRGPASGSAGGACELR